MGEAEGDLLRMVTVRNFEGTITNDVDTLTSYGNLDLLLEQYDPSGNLLSYTQYGGTNIDGATDLMVDNNSTYVIGMTQSPTVNVGTDSFSPDYPSSMYIIKLTQSPIGISPLEQAQLGTLYPNPNNGSFTIVGLVGDVDVRAGGGGRLRENRGPIAQCAKWCVRGALRTR
ncbi:MAG: hypothetical protein IPI00_01000 [Flavobacteriales bacterium]|nr:hypothetical protein [Flavobacteriales bacterium]